MSFRLKKWFLLLSFLSYARFPRRRITNCFPWKAVKWWADAINLFSGLSLVFFFVTFVVFQVLAFWASVSLIICEQEPWNDTAKPHSVKVALQNWSQNRPASVLFVLNWREWQFFAHVLASASSSIMCAKKNILRIIRAFINLMSAHSYKLTIYCIQSTHSARVWGRTEQHVRVCHHPKLKTFVSAWHKRDPKVKQLRFAWMLELCFRRAQKKKSCLVMFTEINVHPMCFRWMKKWERSAGCLGCPSDPEMQPAEVQRNNYFPLRKYSPENNGSH